MSFGALDRIVVSDRPINVIGVTVFDELEQWLDVEWTEARDLSDQATLRVPYSARAVAALTTRRVINLVEEPATPGASAALRAFRIYQTVTRHSREGLVLTVQARSLYHDFTDAGVMTFALSGGTKEFSLAGTFDFYTWMTTVGLPHLQRQGYTWYTSAAAGTAITVPLAFDRWTVAQLAEAIRAFQGDTWRLELDPATWTIGLVQQATGTPAEPLIVEPGQNLLALDDTHGAQDQATILELIGGKGHSTNSRTVQHFAFGASALNAGAKTFQPYALDESGFPYPILQFDGQFVDASGARAWYVLRVDTGRSHKIVATAGAGTAAPTFTLEDWPAKPALPSSWLGEFREGLTPATPIDVPTPGRPLRVAAAPVGAVLTLDDPISNGDPVPTDDVHLDHAVRVSALQLATTCSNIATVAGSTTDQDLTLASTAGLAVGDWGFLHNNVAVPWALFGAAVTIVQLVSGTVVRVRVRYTWVSGLPFTPGAVAKQARFYRVRPIRTFCTDEAAAANTITVSNAATIASQDLIEYHLENAGARLTGIPAPTLLTDGAVRKEQTFAEQRCARNLLARIVGLGISGNPHFADWPGGNPTPTGWTNVAGPALVRVTTNLPGPGVINAVQMTGNTVRSGTPVFVRPTAGDSKVSLRVRLRTGSAANWSGPALNFFRASVITTTGTPLGSVTLYPENHPTMPTGAPTAPPDTVVTLDLLAVDMLHTPNLAGSSYAPVNGVLIEMTAGGQVVVGGVYLAEDSTLPESTYMPDQGDQSLWGVGSLALADVASPTRNVRVDAVDLGRLAREQYPAHAITQDRMIRLTVEDLGLAVERRIALVRRRAGPTGVVTVDVETQQRRFTDFLSNLWSRT